MRILYVTASDPNNRKSWSGVLWSINRELKKYFEVDYFQVSANSPMWFQMKSKMVGLSGYHTMYSHSIARAKKSSKDLTKFLNGKHYDAIFVIDAACLAYVKTDIPIVYYSDGIASRMIDYYWKGLSERTKKEANQVQKLALNNSKLCIVTNKWAKAGAITDYGIPENKIKIVHTGANIETEELLKIEHDEINLLFCGVDWVRKGGEIAVETVRKLTTMDPTRHYVLHMYGCNPPILISDDNIILYGFLNRDMPEQRKIFEELWGKADFFVSPLLADCAAASFCEASAYSVPSVTYDTGGIGDHIINDYNGYRLPEGSEPEKFAQVIIDWLSAPGKLEELKKNAHSLYKTDLNWNTAGTKIRDLLVEVATK